MALTLADLGKAIQKWLDQGFVVPSDAPSFKRGSGRRSGLPAFLSGFLERVFDPSSGTLLVVPDVEAIYAVRQLTLMFSKIALPETGLAVGTHQVVTPERERRAMSDFIQCEQEVRFFDSILDPAYKADFERMSKVLFGDLFDWIETNLSFNGVIPKHGPGAVAERISSNGKYTHRDWPTRLQSFFKAETYLAPSGSYIPPDSSLIHINAGLHPGRKPFLKAPGIHFLEPGSETPVRVVSVPKSLKAPRIIGIEPSAMQFAQQGLYRLFRDGIQRFDPLNSMIGLTDQDPNRSMAREGSLSGDLATLDLSEASDRVSNQHVLALFASHPMLQGAVQACRSRKADVPGHGVIRFAKFSTMGSALCFPIEAMVFLTVIFLGIERELSAPLSDLSAVSRFRQQVRVFGDDLIVPRDYVLSVVDELSVFGHKVNVSKSFWTGRFRESCGREYYDGNDVSIVKVRRILPTQRQDASGVIAASDLRNLLYWGGLWQTARYLDTYLGNLLGDYPNVAPSSPVLGRESSLGYQFQRIDPNTHSPLVRGYYVSAKSPSDPLDGVGALHKCLLRFALPDYQLLQPVLDERDTHIDDANVDDKHLERSGRPEHVSIKLGWRSPF